MKKNKDLTSQSCFCAFCRSPRKVYMKKHLNWTNVGLSLVASTLLMFMMWQDFDPRVIVLFVMGLATSEAFTHLRWRLSLPCSHCGFDPLVYRRNPERAAQKVKEFYDRAKSSPDFYLTKNNLLEVQRRIADGRRQKSRISLREPSL